METRDLSPDHLTDLGEDVHRLIKYESELDQGFGAEIAHLAHGEKFYTCIQCGTCSATCPVSHFMDFTPRRIIAMVRAGFKEEVLRSFTIWLCSSCYSCTADCPREIKITDVMYALKQLAIKEGNLSEAISDPGDGPGILQNRGEAGTEQRREADDEHRHEDESLPPFALCESGAEIVPHGEGLAP